MFKNLCIIFLGLFLLFPAVCYSFTVVIDGNTAIIDYTEPTTNANSVSSPLVDLRRTSIKTDYPNQDGLTYTTILDVPATSVSGGEIINQIVTLPVQDGEEVNVSFTLTATDTSENESDNQTPIIRRIDRLKPNPPQ